MVFKSKERIELEEIPHPELTPDSIIVKVMACALCGSDIRNYHSSLRGGVKSQIMGHEIAGIVVEIGEKVEGYIIGDRVAIAPDVSCGKCYYCERGWVNLCIDHRMIGTHWPGGFAQYILLPDIILKRGMVHHIPDGLSFTEASISEPISSVLASQENIGISLGDTVAIIGDGPIGCFHLDVARIRGATKIILIGLKRLHFAEQFHPDYLIDANNKSPVNEVLNITGGLGVDYCIVATPVHITQEQGIEMVRKRGTVVLFGGLPKTNPFNSINANLIHYNELRVMGAFSYQKGHHRLALELFSKGKIQASKYITKVIPLVDIEKGISSAEKGEVLKVVVDPWI